MTITSNSRFSHTQSKPLPANLFKILLVDDEMDVLEFLSYNLNNEGYQVSLATNGDEAIEIAKRLKPDLIILDMMMPVKNGLQTCSELRAIPEFSKTVIIFLTALFEENNQIIAFQMGADDFITKPVKVNVFLSRIKAHLRRSITTEHSQKVIVGEVEMNVENFTTLVNGKEVFLARKEFKLLQLLSSKPGKVFSREEILIKVWGNEVLVGNRSVDVHIRKLREKIGQNYFKTIKGMGYKIDI